MALSDTIGSLFPIALVVYLLYKSYNKETKKVNSFFLFLALFIASAFIPIVKEKIVLPLGGFFSVGFPLVGFLLFLLVVFAVYINYKIHKKLTFRSIFFIFLLVAFKFIDKLSPIGAFFFSEIPLIGFSLFALVLFGVLSEYNNHKKITKKAYLYIFLLVLVKIFGSFDFISKLESLVLSKFPNIRYPAVVFLVAVLIIQFLIYTLTKNRNKNEEFLKI